jgi:hypothetical protein
MAQDPVMNIVGNVDSDMMGSHRGIGFLYGRNKRELEASRQFREDKRLSKRDTQDKADLMTHAANINDWQQRRAAGVDSDEEVKAAGGLTGAGMRTAVAASRVMGPNGEVIQLGGSYDAGNGVKTTIGGHAPLSPKETGPAGGGDVIPPSGPHPGGLGPQMDGIIDNPIVDQRKERSKISTGREGRLVSSEGEGIRMEQKRIGQKDIKERVAQAGRGVPLVTDAQKEMFKTADMVPTESRPSGRGQRHWQATPRGESQTRLDSLESELPSTSSEDKDYGDIGPAANARMKDALKAKKASSASDTPTV